LDQAAGKANDKSLMVINSGGVYESDLDNRGGDVARDAGVLGGRECRATPGRHVSVCSSGRTRSPRPQPVRASSVADCFLPDIRSSNSPRQAGQKIQTV